MTKHIDHSPLITNEYVAGDEVTISDGFDPIPRPLELDDVSLASVLPVGHIAFLGDFESPKNS